MSPYYILECLSCGERFNAGDTGGQSAYWLKDHDSRCPGRRPNLAPKERA